MSTAMYTLTSDQRRGVNPPTGPWPRATALLPTGITSNQSYLLNSGPSSLRATSAVVNVTQRKAEYYKAKREKNTTAALLLLDLKGLKLWLKNLMLNKKQYQYPRTKPVTDLEHGTRQGRALLAPERGRLRHDA